MMRPKGKTGPKGDQGITGPSGPKGDQGISGPKGDNGKDLNSAPKLVRLASVPLGAEITGLYKTDNGDVFMNVQHADAQPNATDENDTAQVGVIEGIDFDTLSDNPESLDAPSTEDNKLKVLVAGGTYRVLGDEDETFSGATPFGLGAIVNAAGDTEIKQSANPDFNAFVSTSPTGNAGYLFTAWEDRPGSMSRMKVMKDTKGEWSVDANDVMFVDFSTVGGTMINCFGTLSPWGTPLTSEENYEAERTHNWNNSNYVNGYPNYSDVKRIQAYTDAPTLPNPYDYGYIVEITNPASQTPIPVKHFTLGRMAHENAVVMPDQKTVYLTDDGTDKAFYKFVADKKADLSAGTLYAAKVKQDNTSKTDKAGFDIEWIKLGSSNNSDIEAYINKFDGIDEEDFVEGQTNYVTDDDITAYANGDPDYEELAFIESWRAAKAKGATMEWRKMEGIDINYDGAAVGTLPFMYVAMSQVARGMSDSTGDIQLEENKCGAIYRLGLMHDFNVSRMEPVITGGTYDGTETLNRCDVNGIASPDNLIVLDDGRVLIGEDTSYHENNMLWVFNPDGK